MNNRLPSITITIPTYNEELHIRQCLEALKHQDYPKELIETIVVDDFSTDNTREIVNKYSTTVINNGKRDAEYGKMLGLKAAKGELFCYFDADFIIRGKDWLKQMVRPFIEDKSINSSVTRYYSHPKGSTINRYISFDPNQLDPVYSYFASHMRETIKEKRKGYYVCEFSLNKIPPIGGTCIHRKDILLPLVKNYSRYLELDFLVVLVENGFKRFAYVPNAGIYHFHVASFAELCKKRLRNVRQVYLTSVDTKKYKWFDLTKKGDIAKIILWIIYVHAIIPTFLVGIYKSVKNRDIANLYEPLVCLAVTDVILFGFLFNKKGLTFIFKRLILRR